MQSARLPRTLCDTLDTRIRRFLWGGSSSQRKPHLVSWKVVSGEIAQGGLGIRSMRQLNSAYLMKLGWRLQTEPDTIWARLIQEKYIRGRDLFNLEKLSGSGSNAWRGIKEMLPVTHKGMGMAIGDGRYTKFWLHRWLDGKVLSEHTLQTLPEDHLSKKVCDYWLSQDGWDWAQLAPLLPDAILQRIMSFVLDTDEVGDQLVWITGKSGRFNIASAIKMLQPTEISAGGDWTWVWKLCLPQRFRMFLWLLLHGRILTNAERFRRHMAPSSSCSLCPAVVEDLAHVFCGCPQARDVWRVLNERMDQAPDGDQEFHQWLLQRLQVVRAQSEGLVKFVTTLWYIWKWRCTSCFDETADRPSDKRSFLVHQCKEITRALQRDQEGSCAGRSSGRERWVQWEYPAVGWMVLNTDGAAKGNPGPAGAGGVIRADKGEWIRGFSEYLGSCTSVRAELRAVLRGLTMAKDMRVQRLWVQMDSQVVVNMLTRQAEWPPEHKFILLRCKKLLDWDGWEVRLSHCFREANQVADILARLGTSLGFGVTCYSNPPREVRDALHADRVGVSWPRFVKS